MAAPDLTGQVVDGGLPGPSARLTLRDRVLALRDRLVASPRFREWATAFPLTRPVARRRTRALFDLCAGFVYSQVLFACVRVNLFEILAEAPQNEAALARRLGLSPAAAARLLRAAAALGLVAPRSGGRYGLGELGAALRGDAGIAAMIEHHAMLYADLRDPVALLRGEVARTSLGAFWPYAGAQALPDAESVAGYSRLMAASQPMVAAEILAAYDFSRHRCVLDVGGGEGAFLTALATRVAGPRLMLFDLPAVAERARDRFAQGGLSGRAQTFGGSFHTDVLPGGADLITLVRVIHDHDDAPALRILQSAHSALPPDGALLLAEPMASAPGAPAVGDAYFGFYLLAMGSGRARSAGELQALLRAAGFTKSRVLRTRNPALAGVIVAHP